MPIFRIFDDGQRHFNVFFWHYLTFFAFPFYLLLYLAIIFINTEDMQQLKAIRTFIQ